MMSHHITEVPASPRRNRLDPAARKSRAPRAPLARMGGFVTVNGLLVVGSLYTLLPLLWLVFAATKTPSEMYSQDFLSIGSAFLENIRLVLTTNSSGTFLQWMLNSLLYSGIGAVVGGFISVMAGYAFDKFRFRGKEKLFGVVLVGVLIPSTATVLPLYLLASTLGITDTVWSIFIPVICNPFGVYLARVFSAGYIPNETLEAGRVDGAGSIRSFFELGFPMIAPGFVTIVLFQFVGIWNNFMLPLVMLQNGALYPVSLGMAIWNGHAVSNPEYTPLVIAGSLLSIIPLLIAFICLQRFWKAGLTAGAIK